MSARTLEAHRPFDAEQFLLRLRAQDAALAAASFPPISAWWWATIERFLRARASRPSLRTLVARVGRRGGKSSTLCRLAVCWALHGTWDVPPGDIGVVAFVSVSRDEAGQRLRTISALLDALRIPWRRTVEGVELDRLAVLFKVFPASLAAVIGFTAIALLCDEVCSWRDADTGANPATQVLAKLMPTLGTQRWAFRVLSSAPMSTQDAHYEAFERGDTDDQTTAYAPTWEANGTITEEDTHSLEPDLRIWAREYAALPQPSVLGAFDALATERAFLPRLPGCACKRVLVIDASSGRKDTWSWAIAGWVLGPPSPFMFEAPPPYQMHIRIHELGGFEGAFWKQISGEVVVQRLAEIAHRHRVTSVHADQRESLMLKSAFERYALSYTVHDWTAASKPEAVEQVRRWFADDMLALPEHKKLRRELLAFEERVTASGQFTFGARGGGHDDFVALLITLAMADAAGALLGSPHSISRVGGSYWVAGI